MSSGSYLAILKRLGQTSSLSPVLPRAALVGGMAGLVLFGTTAFLAEPSRAQETPAPDSAANSGTIRLDPINVTVRRRLEDIQDAPVAATVVTQDEIGLQNVDTLEDVAFQSPNTVFNEQGGPLAIRGIGSLGLNGGVDRQPAVGVFLDDVFISRPFGYPIFLDDTQRVEVVRGSQATLYGKNTIGGAINLITRDPGLTPGIQTQGSLSLDRDFEEPTGRGSLGFDAPLSEPSGIEDLALRGYASWTRSDGYITNQGSGTVNDINALATRAALAGTLGGRTDFRLSGDYSRQRDDGGLWFAPLDLALDYRSDHDFPAFRDLDIAGFTARIDHDWDALSFTSITAVRGHELDIELDGDFTSNPGFPLAQAQTESQRQVSQEIRLSAEHGPLGVRGGLFYMREWFEGDQFFDLATLPRSDWSRLDFDQDTDTYSVFAELSYAFTPSLEVIGGLRYIYETKDTTSETSSPSGNFFLGAGGRVNGTQSYDNLSPELAVQYRPTEEILTFARVSRGFKSGGISPFIDVNNTANAFDPELTTSFEVGANTSWLDDRLRLNASLFHIDWQDQQAVISVTPTVRVIRNAAEATSRGIELDGAFQATESLLFTASYGYLDTEYDDFVDTVLGQDFSGNPLPYAPEHSAGLGLRLAMPLNDVVTIQTGLDYNFRSSYSFNPDNLFRQEPTHLFDARVGVRGNGWSATLWGKNLGDEQYLRQYFDFGGTDFGVAAEGRTVGLTVTANW